MGSFIVNSASTNNFNYNLFINTTAATSATYYLNKMNSAILKDATKNSKAEIKLSLKPFPYTYKEKS